MAAVITESELRRRTPEQVAAHITALTADGHTPRQILIAVAEDAIAAAEDGLWRIRTWLRDGWNGDPMHIPITTPSPVERDRQLLAAMAACTNAATLVAAIRTRQNIDRPTGWDPLTDTR